jgi:hypothetical protein
MKEVDIQPFKTKVNKDAVRIIEEFLEMAKAGRIQEVMILGIGDNGSASNFTPSLDYVKRLGAIEMLKIRWAFEQMRNEES